MEDRKFDPNEQSSENSEKTPEPKKTGESLLQYFLRKRDALDEAEDDNEAEGESTEKSNKKRWRIFKGFFSNIVSDPKDADAQKHEKTEYISPFSWSAVESTDFSKQTTEDGSVVDEDPVHKTVSRADDETYQTTENSLEPGSSPRIEADELPEETARERNNTSAPEEVPASVVESPQLAESLRPSERARIEKETVIERGTGNVLPLILVGAEYLARKKADRKLENRIARTTDELQGHTTRESLNTEQLQSLVKQNREQVEKLKYDRGITSPELPKQVETRHVVERESQPIGRGSLSGPEVLNPERQNAQMRIASEQAQEAVESTARLERVIERSHEVKDDQTAPGAVSVGAVAGSRVAQTLDQINRGNNSAKIQDFQGLPIVSDDQSSAVYKRAMKTGFWTAITIIVFGVLAYLMIK